MRLLYLLCIHVRFESALLLLITICFYSYFSRRDSTKDVRFKVETLHEDQIRCKSAIDKIQTHQYFGCIQIGPHLSIDKKKIIFTRGSLPLNNIQNEYLEQEMKFLNDVSKNNFLNHSGSVLFSLSDEAILPRPIETELFREHTPLLSHSHDVLDTNLVVFQPDFHFIKTYGFKDIITQLNSNKKSWNTRNSRVFWRGSSTGYYQETGCFDLPRVKMCILAVNVPWLDIKLTKLVQQCQGNESEAKAKKIYAVRQPEVKRDYNMDINVFSFHNLIICVLIS